ncbi:MAG TPA: hypothetical protein VN578_20340 [Candidatus Binatia bacterium]|nr:hypothetical protein [Candidatus Binatia bacterium]
MNHVATTNQIPSPLAGEAPAPSFRAIVKGAVMTGILFLCSLSALGDGEKEILSVCFYTAAADKRCDYVAWEKMVKLFNDNLANAKQFNLYADTCYSGRVIDLQGAAKSKLSMAFVIGTASKTSQIMEQGWCSKDKDPGRLPKLDTNGDPVNNRYYYSYTAYVAKKLRAAAAVPGVKALHDAATGDVKADKDLSQEPQFLSGNGADETWKLNSGGQNYGLVFGGSLRRLYPDLLDQTYLAMLDLKLTSLKFYASDLAAKTYNKVVISGSGTVANFEAALGEIKNAMKDRANTDEVTLMLLAHGAKVEANALSRLDAVPGTPKQGVLMAQGTNGQPFTLDIPMDADAWTALKQGVVQDDPTLASGAPPSFFLAVSAASLSSPFMVTVGGYPLGLFSLPSNSTGALLQVTITNTFVQDLILAHDGETNLTLEFDMAPGDSMTLALDDDVLFDPNYTPAMYGTGLALTVTKVSEQVALEIQPQGSTVGLSWADEVEGFRLQQSDSLNSGVWQFVPLSGTNSAVVPTGPSGQIFRLIKP